MLEYAHLVPGRLRIKLSEFRHPEKAAEAEAHVAALPMVTSAVANRMTGSLTINFDKQLPVANIWDSLRAQNYVSGRCPEPATTGGHLDFGPNASRFGRAFTAAFFEAIVQHSAQALVRALL